MFFQLNYDADGPEYFQSTETTANFWTPNQTGIYSVVNSIEDKLTRTDWPGMPQKSFYDKWLAEAVTLGDPNAALDTLREVDQVAWNIAAWGTYAATANRLIMSATILAHHRSAIRILPLIPWEQRPAEAYGRRPKPSAGI